MRRPGCGTVFAPSSGNEMPYAGRRNRSRAKDEQNHHRRLPTPEPVAMTVTAAETTLSFRVIRRRLISANTWACAAIALVLAACGSSGVATSPVPSPTAVTPAPAAPAPAAPVPAGPVRVTITSSGVSPVEVTVDAG